MFLIVSFARHCIRSKQSISERLTSARSYHISPCQWASNANYSRQLLRAIGRMDGLVTSVKEVHKLILDREAWQSRINLIKLRDILSRPVAVDDQ
jgi:hypothetical protein